MPRACSICQHTERAAIDKALVGPGSLRDIAGQFRVSKSALERHKAEHLPVSLVTAQKARHEAEGIDAMAELRRLFQRVNKLYDACDRWLTDPDDPERYTLEPRADDVQVLHWEPAPDGRMVLRKAPISALLARLRAGGVQVEGWEVKHADPRELVLKTAKRLQGQIEVLSKLIQMEDIEERLAALEQRLGKQGGVRTWGR